MRFDKEMLIKHHFWILLGVYFVLILVVFVLINMASADVGGKAKTEFENAKSAIGKAAGQKPKNSKFDEPWIKYGQVYKGQKDRVWKEAWEGQQALFEWPPREGNVDFSTLKYPDDPIPHKYLATYREESWKRQFENLEAEIAPVEFLGGSPTFVQIMMPGFGGSSAGIGVQTTAPTQPSGIGGLLGGGSRPQATVAQPTEADASVWDGFWKKLPTEEEVWLAQEDFWVKRELLRIIRAAVANVARFEEIKTEANKDMPQGIVARHLFRSQLWEINLLLEKQGRDQWIISDRSTIKNLHPDRRTVPLSASPTSGGLHFIVKQGNRKIPFKVDGEPLPFDTTTTFRTAKKIDSIEFKNPFELEQVFEPANCPIRQIRAVELGKHSHRTASQSLLPSLNIKAKAEDPAAAPGGGAPGTPPPAKLAPGGAPAAAAAPGGGDFTPNHLPRLRYMTRSEQCRTIPVGLLLVVDQSHKHEILVALANSRLRIQTTQVQYRHLTGFHTVGEEQAYAAARTANGGGPTMEEDPNLMEVAVYGIATLYERYPPKNNPPAPPPASPPPPAGAQPGTPTTGQAAKPTTPTTGAPTPGTGSPTTKPGAKPVAVETPQPAASSGKATEAPKPPATGKPAEPPATAKPADKPKDGDPKKP
jgi:hypothetical protein